MKSRLILFALVIAVWTGGLGARLYRLQVGRHTELAATAANQQQLLITIAASRGTIYDTKGRELAVSVEVESIWAVPRAIKDREATARRLADVLGLDAGRLAEKLDSDAGFKWVARKVDPELSAQVRALGLDGIYFEYESRRYYPMGSQAAHVLGFVGMDGNGLAGLEARYEDVVTGRSATRMLLRDAKQKGFAIPGYEFSEPEPGNDLYVTIDAALQYLAETELARAVSATRADGGVVVILDAADSAVLAMASSPTFDPNHFSRSPQSSWRNRAVAEVFEPGSTFKMVTAAAAFDSLLISPDDPFFCEEGSITLGRTRIRDHKPFGLLTFREVLEKSSNVGIIKAALILGDERLHSMIRSFGFGRRTGIDLPGEAAGIVNPMERWRESSKAYISFGQEISATPIQMASAFAAVASGGVLHRPYVVKAIGRGDGVEPVDRQVDAPRTMAAHTAVTLGRVLETVVESGTGRLAQVPGYRVAGKTGTAEKVIPGVGYSPTARMASFIGFLPAREPRLVGFVMLDHPRTQTHGGQVAAPVFSAIMKKALLYLGVAPDPELWPPRPAEPVRPPPVFAAGSIDAGELGRQTAFTPAGAGT